MRSRLTGVLAAVALVGGAAAVSVAVSQASPRRSPVAVAAGGKVSSKETGIKYTSKVIVVPRSTVKRDLSGISAAGVFKFKHPSGALKQLRAGKVMVLQGSDALVVSKLRHSRGDLLVTTKPANLTDVISSGRISFTGTPNFDQAVAQKIVAGPSTAADRAANDFARPTYPYVGTAPDPSDAVPADAGSFSVQGTVDPFGYSLTFTPAGSRLNIDGVLCFATTSVCGNGPSSGLSFEAHISGYIQVGKTDGGLTVSGGKETGSSFQLGGFTAHLDYTYQVTRGDGSDGDAKPPLFHVPVGIDYTIPGEIPIYLKLQTNFLLELGVTAKNSIMRGGLDINAGGGTDTIHQSGKSVSTSASGDKFGGTVLDQANGQSSLTLGPSGVVFALQLPKLGVGLGFTSANAIAYVDVLTALGQTSGGLVGGQYCSTYDLAASIGTGLEAQVGLGKLGLSYATPRKIIYPTDGKQIRFTTGDPECPS